MIPLDLLRLTENRAVATLVYGPSGTKKTFGVHTLPPPICHFDFEGGNQSILPWVRSRVDWDGSNRIDYSDQDRENFMSMLKPGLNTSRIKPQPLIDITWFDPMNFDCYNVLVQRVVNFEKEKYNSFSCDSLQEFATETQTFSKGVGRSQLTMNESGAWGNAQERAGMLLRYMRSLRNQGVFIYFTCSEQIDKDYVVDPRNQSKNAKEEPFIVKGTANVPGKMTSFVQHVTDFMFHTRTLMGNIVWVSKPEPVGGGMAMWEVKDNFGRLKQDYNEPNMRLILDQVYGEETRKKIYASR